MTGKFRVRKEKKVKNEKKEKKDKKVGRKVEKKKVEKTSARDTQIDSINFCKMVNKGFKKHVASSQSPDK